jgi:hypothetical protein
MGKKLNEAYSLIRVEAEHYLRLSQSRPDNVFDAGFASGYAEALRIISSIRNRYE